MRDFIVLKFLDKFKGIFEKMGVDYKVMRRIIQVKLVMDGRRVPTVLNNSAKRRKKLQEEDSSFFRPSFIYILISLIMLPFILINIDYAFGMSIVFAIAMFMIMTSLIADFSSVLLDLRDKNIIFSKPVASKTLSMAKTVHICIYIFSLTISLTGVPLVAALIRRGPIFFIVFLLGLILMDLLVIMLTSLLYFLILKFFDGEKLKDIINYVQIILTITLSVGYQLVARIFNFVGIDTIVFTPKWWQYFIIPVWFGAPFDLIMHRSFNPYYVVFSVMAIAIPILSIIIYLKLVPAFERNLQKLENNGEKQKKTSKLIDKISEVICKSKIEKVFFKFTYDMIKNERDFKLKVYPSIGLGMALPIIFVFNDGGQSLKMVGASKRYITLYIFALLLPTVIMMLKYSKDYKAAWIYKVTPIKNSGDIYRGAFKSILVRIIIPVYIIEGIIYMGIFGVKIFPQLILIFLNLMFYIVICFKAFKKAMPFSLPYETGRQSEGLVILPLMLVVGALAAIHLVAVIFMPVAVYALMAVMLLINLVVWRFAFKVKI